MWAQKGREGLTKLFNRLRVRRVKAYGRQSHSGGIAEMLAIGDFLGVEPLKIMGLCMLDGVVLGGKRLHDDLAGDLPPTGTPGHLCEQLKRPLCRPKIG
jgi:hypothetical protein